MNRRTDMNFAPEPWPPVPAGWADIPFAEKLMLCIAAAVAMAVGILGVVW
jgi:hypothetical protein